MKICFFISEKLSGRGGIESVLKNTAKGMLNRGHNVQIILATRSENPIWEEGLPIKYLYEVFPVFKTYDEKLNSEVSLLGELLYEDSLPEFIITLSAFSIKIAKYTINKLGIHTNIISWLHFSIHKEKFKDMLAFADGHLCISTGIFEQLQNETPLIPCELVFNSVNVRNQLIKRSNTSIFIYIGRLDNEQKRIDLLFKSLSRIDNAWKLLVVGEGQDKLYLLDLAEKLKIAEKISWYGWKEDPWSYINEGTALILSSDYEGFGLVLVEALSRGLTVIASDCYTGPKDIVLEGINGWLFRPDNEDQLTDILVGIVNGNLKLPDASICVESVQKFDIDSVAGNFERALKNMSIKKVALKNIKPEG